MMMLLMLLANRLLPLQNQEERGNPTMKVNRIYPPSPPPR